MTIDARAGARLVLAALAAGVAIGARALVDPWLGDHLALVTLFPAIAIVGHRLGYGAALVTGGLGYVGCLYFFMPPRRALGGSLVELAAYVVSASIIIGLGEVARRAQAREHERVELLRVTLASVGDALVTTDAEARVTSMNPIAETLSGWTAAEARGRPLDDVLHFVDETTRRRIENPVARALRHGTIAGFAEPTLLIDRHGAERPIDDSAAPIRDRGGRVSGGVLVLRDVTARRHAERALERSEHELADLFETASIGLHWAGPDGTILRANQAELDMLGYTAEEYVGRSAFDVHVDRPAIEALFARLRRGEILREVPARLRCKDGSIRDVLISASVLFREGDLVHARVFTVDVTERTRAHEAQALLAAIVAASDDAIVSKTLEGTILSWNGGAERLFGYTPEEAVGRNIDLIIPNDRLDEERSILERLRRGERVDHFETTRVTKSGRLVDASLTVSPVRDEAGRIVGASKIARDVTRRKQAERALRESAERFRELANNIDQFAWTCDELGRATWYNQRWYDYTGTTFEQAQGEGWKQVVHPEHLERVVAGIARCVASGTAWEDTFPLRARDGRYRWFLSRSVPIRDEGGRVVRWFGSNTDVTQQREWEQALEHADRRKDEFLATLAHELRNPLAPMSSAVQILLKDHAPDRQRWAAGVIDRQMRHLVRLLDDLLDVARISHDKLELDESRVDLAEVVRSAVETSQPRIDEGGHELTLSLPSEPIVVYADPVRLAQIFANLLNNAAKYTEPGGRLRLACEVRGDRVIASVSDDGIGIEPEALPRIFDMFAQEPGTADRAQGGLGIGLALVRALVELHGGTIRAQSGGRGQGSTFTVELPRSSDDESAHPARKPTPAPERARAGARPPRRLLIADDHRNSADSLATLLRMYGHEVRTAYDGPEAVATATTFEPDVVLLDIGMPGMNGYEACRRLRRQAWARTSVFVALTGWGQEADRRRAAAAGFDHHIVKPVDVDELLALLDGRADREAEA